MTLTFTHASEGRVHCHGDPPLSLMFGETVIPCPDPTAACCTWTPPWEVGVEKIACVNAAGPGESVVVEVPEVGLVPGLLVGLVLAAAWAWVVKAGC